MHNVRLFRAALAVAALFVASTGTLPAQQPAVTTIRFTSTGSDDMRPILYAQSAGLFQKAGLDVEINKAASGATVAQAVVGGAMDVGKSSLVSLITGYARGIPFVLIAPSAIHQKDDANDGILIAANSPLKSVLDLQGKVVACTAIGDIGYLGTRAMIDSLGGDSSTVKWVEIPTTALGPAIEQGRVEAGITIEPYMSGALATGKFRILADMLNGYSKPILESAYFARKDWVDAHRDAVARFAKVLAQASEYANTHVNETVPLLVSFTGMDPATATKMHKTFTALTFDPAAIQPVIDTAAKYQFIPKAFPARDMLPH